MRLFLCSRCKAVGYCSKECQKEAWPAHKKNMCDLVVAWRAGLEAQGVRFIGPCSEIEIAEAQKHYTKCENAIFIAYFKAIYPSGQMGMLRWHVHHEGVEGCKGANVTHVETFQNDNSTTVVLPEIKQSSH